jgi:hypothetical protein
MMRDAERILSPLRDFEGVYGHAYQQVAQEAQARENLLKSALPDFADSYQNAIHSMKPALDLLQQFQDHSPSMGLLANANCHLASIMLKEAELERVARSSVAIAPQWQEAAIAYQRLGENTVAAAEKALKSHFATIAETSFLAQQRLLRVPWDSIGGITSINPSEFIGVRDHFTTLTERYQSLALSYDKQENLIASFPPIVSGGPPLEILTSAKVLDYLSRHIDEEEDEELFCQAESDYEDDIERDTNKLLEAFSPDSIAVWFGAKEALRSGNPDRGRHVSASLRELVTHVLHALAPDSDIRSWSNDPRHFHNGRPTREARVLYICRGINHGPFSDFVSADVRASVEVIELFQKGTHKLATPFSDEQLRALIVRAESLLRFLLLTNQSTH